METGQETHRGINSSCHDMEPAAPGTTWDFLYQELLLFHLFSTTASTEAGDIFKSQECIPLFHLDTIPLKTAAASPFCTCPQQSHWRIFTPESTMQNQLLNNGHKTFPLFCTRHTCLHRCETSPPEVSALSDARHVLGVHCPVLTKHSLQKAASSHVERAGSSPGQVLFTTVQNEASIIPHVIFRVFYTWI